MSNLQIIEKLCGILKDMAHIIVEQRKVLAQYDALFMEEEIAVARTRYIALLSQDEWPDLVDLPPEGG